jgi:uncharacterized membrane protein YgcG
VVKTGHVNRLAVALVGMLAVLTVISPFAAVDVAHADKSFTFDAWEARGEVALDGSMSVTEKLTYNFSGGPFTVGIRSFARNLDSITSFAASDDQGPLEVVPPSESPSGSWEWNMREPVSDRSITFTLTYVARDIAVVGSDVGDVDWEPIGSDHPGIASVDIAVQYVSSIQPATSTTADDDASVLRAFGHGPVGGEVTTDLSSARLVATDVAAEQFVGLLTVVPATAFNVVGSEPRLAAILEQERSYIPGPVADPPKPEPIRHRLAFVFTPLVMALGALGLTGLWATRGREAKSTEVLGEYWREPLDDPPAIAILNLGRGSANSANIVSGTLIDLAQRGFLTITGEKKDGLLRDSTVNRYRRTGKAITPDVEPYEQSVLDLVFRGQIETTSEELQQWATKRQSDAKKALDAVTKGANAAYKARGYEDTPKGNVLGLLVGVCLGVALVSVIIRIVTGNGVGWFGVAAAAILFIVGLRLLSNRTQAGVEAGAKAAGLKRYLKDFSRLDDAPIGHLILWERYLVYAVALGVADDLVRGMAVRVPEVLGNPALAAWYIGGGVHRFDNFGTIQTTTNAFVSASTPNTTGSGGGVVSGGGGGFGGGGAGAR